MRPLETRPSVDIEAVYSRLQLLEDEVERLREENARLRRHGLGIDDGPGRYSLVAAERDFMIPPPPTYRELPAMPAPAPRRHAPHASPPSGGIDVGYVNRVSAEELDVLPYGLVVLDRDGRVLLYNETESRLTGFARGKVLGKNFFREVAPCTAVQEFEGVFREFVAGKRGRTVFFDFAFHFSAGTQNVTIALAPGRRPGQTNVMMMRR